MDGFNNCLFAYGQTGSGKTHSVLGADDPPENRGLLPRILLELFKRIETTRSSAKVEFQCQAWQEHAEFDYCSSRREPEPTPRTWQVSYLEIYNEQIRDLLVPLTDKPAKLTAPLLQVELVRHHPKLGIYVAGLTTNAVTTYEEVQSILDFGAKSRSVPRGCKGSVGASGFNEVCFVGLARNSASSRSHCIFNFVLLKREVADGVDSEQRASVNLVDLAGSERQKKTGASGSLLKEGAMINQSLSNLALVINKLAASGRDDGKADFVPFRNSKLTHILQLGWSYKEHPMLPQDFDGQESLSGNSKTVMIAALSPALSNFDETLSTLKFARAQTCKNVATKAVRNQATFELYGLGLSLKKPVVEEQMVN
ncbi:KIF13B [Symbiodinium pilosum]|uniref:Kinesin-like protein n=1 Tax=Symbiodinium pilosum TaxID=2952 RepID=A0A812J0N9_SYMPI|nr:KIF13B [Symbiodinium pilosum]